MKGKSCRFLASAIATAGIAFSILGICSSVQSDEHPDHQEVATVIKRYSEASELYRQRKRDLKTSVERAKLRSELLPELDDAEAEAIVSWAAARADHQLALRALRLVMEHGTESATQLAVDDLIVNHLDLKGNDFREMVMSLHQVNDTAPECAEKCLRAYIERAEDVTTRGVACWMLAMYKADLVQSAGLLATDVGQRIPAHRVGYLKQVDCEATLGEAFRLLERVKRDFGTRSIQIGSGRTATLAQIADRDYRRVQGLLKTAIGKQAPPIVGIDVNGKGLKLSDFRGKVVVINFWSTNCAPCLRLIPDEKRLVEKYRNQPFALVGVNLDPDRETATETITKYDITWHNWWIEPNQQDSITTAWNVQFRPAFYVLDKSGVIRFAHLRGDKLREAIDVLMEDVK